MVSCILVSGCMLTEMSHRSAAGSRGGQEGRVVGDMATGRSMLKGSSAWVHTFVLQSSGSAQSYKCESQRADEGHGPIRRRLVLELGVVCDEAAGSAATMQGGRLQFLALQPRRCGRQQETMQVETARMVRSKRRCSAAEQRCEGRDGRWSGHSRCDGSSNLEEGWSAAPQRGRVRL